MFCYWIYYFSLPPPGLLWNLSSADSLKPDLLKTALPVLMERVVLPYTAESTSTKGDSRDPEVFYHATGFLRYPLTQNFWTPIRIKFSLPPTNQRSGGHSLLLHLSSSTKGSPKSLPHICWFPTKCCLLLLYDQRSLSFNIYFTSSIDCISFSSKVQILLLKQGTCWLNWIKSLFVE